MLSISNRALFLLLALPSLSSSIATSRPASYTPSFSLNERSLCCRHILHNHLSNAYQCRPLNGTKEDICRATSASEDDLEPTNPVPLASMLEHIHRETYIFICPEGCSENLYTQLPPSRRSTVGSPPLQLHDKRDDGDPSPQAGLPVPVIAGVAIGSFTAGILTAAITYLLYRMYRSRKIKEVRPDTMPYDNFYRNSGPTRHDYQTSTIEPGSSTLVQPVRSAYFAPSASQSSLSRSHNPAQSTVSGSSGSRSHHPRAHGKRAAATASSASGSQAREGQSQRDLDELRQQVTVIKEQIKWMKKERRRTQSHAH